MLSVVYTKQREHHHHHHYHHYHNHHNQHDNKNRIHHNTCLIDAPRLVCIASPNKLWFPFCGYSKVSHFGVITMVNIEYLWWLIWYTTIDIGVILYIVRMEKTIVEVIQWMNDTDTYNEWMILTDTMNDIDTYNKCVLKYHRTLMNRVIKYKHTIIMA